MHYIKNSTSPPSNTIHPLTTPTYDDIDPDQIDTSPIMTSNTTTNPRSIPMNAYTNNTSEQTSHHSSSFYSTLFFQNWLLPSTSTTSTTTGQNLMDQQQSTFLSPFYYSQYGSLGTSSFISPSYASSFFDRNHVDVIMDDGTRQKRTISLTTVPLFPSFPSNLSPRENLETTHLLPFTFDQRQYHQNNNSIITAAGSIDQQDNFSDSDEDNDGDNKLNSKKKTMKSSTFFSWIKLSTLTTGQKRVLKCSLAYILGSLFTFVPLLHEWVNGGYGEDGMVRNRVASSMAATVTVFFNPAKTVGGMVEAAGIGWIMTLGALAVCLASLWTTDYFLDYLHQTSVSYAITLIGWLLTSTLLLTFLKARYSDRPSVGTASSLAFIILFPILVREHTLDESEYSRQKIQDTFAIVAIGTAISSAVCFFIWPQTATEKFNSNMYDSLQSLRILLKLLTKTFLLDADLPDFKANEPLAQAIKTHATSFTALQSSLREARLEWWRWNKSDNCDDGYDRMVKSIQRLALHIGGLRKSCGLQFDRTHNTSTISTIKENDNENVTYQIRADDHRRKFERTLKREHSTQDTSLAEQIDEEENYTNSQTSGNDGNLINFLRTTGPPMKSLAFTCKQTIIHLQYHFTPSKDTTTLSPPPSFSTLRENLGLALEVFEQSQQKALTRLYRRHISNKNKDKENGPTTKAKTESSTGYFSPTTPHPSTVHSELLTQFPEDDLFLVYFFVFCLSAFAKELMVTVTCMEQVFDRYEKRISITSLMFGIKCLFTAAFQSSHNTGPFLSNNQHTVDTLHTPAPSNLSHSFRLGVWSFLSWFRKYQVRYAIKAGLTTLVVASMAFFPSTQDYFQTYRMEWTLITALAVMTPTVGGTNFNAILRLGATVVGVVIGACCYQVFSGYHVVVLIFLTWMVSLPCFWMILHQPKYGKFGQFVLLAYTLVILYKYNHPDVNVFDLAYQRCVAVCQGVIIGLVVTTYMWPYEARKEVRLGLSDLLLRFSWQYYQLNNTNNNMMTTMMMPTMTTTTTMMLMTTGDEDDDDITLNLQHQLYDLSVLLSHAPNEPRLKGRFPVKTYQVMLELCQSILDNLVMMRMVMKANQQTNKQGTEMEGNVVLYFYVLASALQLKTPLPPYLPPADMARKQLIGRLQSSTMHHASISSYMDYYAYIVLMETMLTDMDQLGSHMKALYGSLIPHWHN
ncbi:Fusaric acid resistance protein-like-domain-containing protein [Halteromyces radiatus]|uniref:Fusaric acid resistance protein-like-domain-containing protein n=1 Tax=Halteromyces radiatus TaxID=101107 RepID=UPI00222102A8|nr:Fusaric acid resistance protein-like-domain-containing protein [Halteromyces radiatus]KAI8082708.1 Fusaric acid resistance protein-like-domain-containing protein [Halteromyces radiatus]